MQNSNNYQHGFEALPIVSPKEALMQAYKNWVNKRLENSRSRLTYQQPLDSDAFNDELINALGLEENY